MEADTLDAARAISPVDDAGIIRRILRLLSSSEDELRLAGDALDLVRLSVLAAAAGRKLLTARTHQPLGQQLREAGEQLAERPGPGALLAAGGSDGLPEPLLQEVWRLLGEGRRPLPARLPGDLLEALRSRAARRRRGSFFTPAPVIRWLLRQTGVPPAEGGRALVDPACGGGAFLVEAFSMMQGPPSCRLERLAGSDIDYWAVATTRAALWLELPPGSEAELLLPGRILVGNALMGEPGALTSDGPRPDLRALNWPERYGGAYPFSVVVGNPPYYSLERSAPELCATAGHYDDLLCARGRPNVFGLFIKRALDLVSMEHGRIGLVLPLSLARVRAYESLRALLARSGHVQALADLGRATAAAGYEQLALVLRPHRGGPPESARTRVYCMRGAEVAPRQEHPQALLVQRRSVPLALDAAGLALLRDLEARHRPLAELGTMFRGLPFSVRQPGFVLQPQPGAIPCLRGADITRYRIRGWGHWQDDESTARQAVRLKQRLKVPKLVMPNVVSSRVRANAAYDQHGLLSLDTVTNLIPHDGVSPHFLLGVLNSSLATFLLREGIFNGALLTNHLDPPYLGRLPVPEPSGAQAAAIAELARKLTQADEEQPDLEARLDGLVRLAYGLDLPPDVSLLPGD